MTTQQVQRSSVVPSHTESLTLVKNLMGSTISTICYLRGLFPEENFKDSVLHSMPLKSVKKDYSLEADEVLDWLEKGIYDALARHYLKSLIFGIYLDPTKPEELIESYTFGFSYPSKDQWCITIGDQAKDVFRMKTKKEIVKATSEMIRRVIVLTQTLNNAHVTMRLYYYDDVTPHDYEPPCFTAGSDRSMFTFPHHPDRFQLGQVDTPYHSLGLHISTAADSIQQASDEQEEVVEHPTITSGGFGGGSEREGSLGRVAGSVAERRGQSIVENRDDAGDKENRAGAQIASDSLINTLGSMTFGDSQILMMDSEIEKLDQTYTQELVETLKNETMNKGKAAAVTVATSNQIGSKRMLRSSVASQSTPRQESFANPNQDRVGTPDDRDQEDGEVLCPCKVNENDGYMIQCNRCLTWSHAICFGFMDAKDPRIPKDHYCYTCVNEIEILAGREPLYDMNEAGEVAIFRRALGVAWCEGVWNVSGLAKRLGVPLSEAKKVVGRLEKEGILQPRKKSHKKKGKNPTPSFEVLKTQHARFVHAQWLSASHDPHIKKRQERQKPLAKTMEDLSTQVEKMNVRDMDDTIVSAGLTVDPLRRMSVDSDGTDCTRVPVGHRQVVLVAETPVKAQQMFNPCDGLDPIDTIPSSPELIGSVPPSFHPSPPKTVRPIAKIAGSGERFGSSVGSGERVGSAVGGDRFANSMSGRRAGNSQELCEGFGVVPEGERQMTGFLGEENGLGMKRKGMGGGGVDEGDKENVDERLKRRKVSVVRRDIAVL
ncbi:HORMA domain-containing protein 1 [Dinochytrium kinnereticum]|nr:HORMA domain-containing protein 1 [Dinochytrium kinnereticum]